MNPLAPAAVNRRRAALLVHAMPAVDRDWVLQALPAAQREALQGLLVELHGLALAPDPALLHALSQEPAAPVADSAEESLARLAGPQLQALAAVLREEPAPLVLRLLAMRAWPWKDAVLPQLPLAMRQAQRAASPLPRAPALEHALCEAVLRRLSKPQAVSGTPAWGRWRRMRASLRWTPGARP